METPASGDWTAAQNVYSNQRWAQLLLGQSLTITDYIFPTMRV